MRSCHFAVQTESALWAVTFSSEYGFDAAERSAIIEYARKMYHNEREISDAAISNVLTLSDGDRRKIDSQNVWA
ncbi:hypothetical protein [Rhizobium ruizarguesonis]|uniref:hypothetical protein n=1 Tax=Rhizobium ruizarguesonis TaxID=2081791 RepID=UPI000371778E|nr:hypothetical protein [Rhizobium ruizarguesonis]NEH75580.1 hypothetical protein [Rhizobium ruizarguesonis]NEI76607.1 hypothetical protein [Rhizobium ruizarguesonis]TBC67973.1 hypothetical protein ELH30_35650 [Rhizobium ruizarguesonis]